MASCFLRRRLSTSTVFSNVKFGASICIHTSSRQLSSSTGAVKIDFTDLTRPHTWYPAARRKKRNVFLHVGPTNSGKTYSALKQLELSSSGVYCGPLRLLAWEVAKRLNKANVPCDFPDVSVESYQEDSKLWKMYVGTYKRANRLIGTSRYRNIMNLNAGLGGFAATLDSIMGDECGPYHCSNHMGCCL